MYRVIDKVNLFLEGMEARCGLFLFSLLTGLPMLGMAMIYVAPRFEAGFNGAQYVELSNDPFLFTGSNPLRFRMLAPLLGYITGLRGPLFFILPLIFALLFLSAVYFIYRKKNFSSLDALLMVSLIAFSCVMLIQLQAPGYTDVIYFFFLFLAFAFIRKPYKSAVFYCLALLTHESCLFMFPGLVLYSVYLQRNDLRSVFKYAILLVLAIIPLFLMRYWISSQVSVAYDMNFYFSDENVKATLNKVLPLIPLGFFFVFKLVWIIPAYVLVRSIQKREYIFVLFIVSMIVCDLAQMAIAYDVTRMLCLAFPLVLITAEELKKELKEERFSILLLILITADFFIPEYFMSCDGPNAMLPWFLLH